MTEDKSTRYHRRRRRADFAGTVLVGGFLLVLSASGAASLVRSGFEWLTSWLPGPAGPLAAASLYLVGLVATVHALELPFAWYQGHFLERRYGLTTQILPHWLADHVKAVTASSAVMVGGLATVYVCMRLWPAGWWVPAAAAFTAVMVGFARLGPAVLVPILLRVRPLRRAALSERLVRLAQRAGAPVIGVYEWSIGGHTREAKAALAGIGRSRRILLSDTMLDGYSDDEIEVVLAHELAHHVHRDLWLGMALRSATLFVGAYLAAAVVSAAGPWLGLRTPVDAASAPLLLLVAGAWSFAFLPLANAVSRAQERRADRFALALTGNPGAFVTAMRRLGHQNLAEERPSALARWLFYSHPPLRERIAFAESWRDVAPALAERRVVSAED
ncbi:MAG: M48 family metalloprotease [Vicinamibacterales bacterium]